MKIGFNADNYNAQRNIIGAVKSCSYKRVFDLHFPVFVAFRALEALCKLDNHVSFSERHRFNDLTMNSVDLLHFFNGINLGSRSWLSTFETLLPRTGETRRMHSTGDCSYDLLVKTSRLAGEVRSVASKSCKQIIGMSQCSVDMQNDFIERCWPEFSGEITPKASVLHPPQPILIDDYGDRGKPDQLSLMMVGSSFVRKGGREILDAVQSFRAKSGCNIRLVIVSSLMVDNYATGESAEDLQRIGQRIAEERSWIEHYPLLPNSEVLNLMKSVDIGLLPTYADTYGYSLLEFQACGCPVVSTNIRALPEINNNDVGWVIEVPKDRLGEARYRTAGERDEISRRIRDGLWAVLEQVATSKQVVKQKALRSIDRIRAVHDPERFGARLNELYHEALR